MLTDGGDSPNTPGGTYPDTLHRLYYPVACQHCENPACVKVCPVGATYKDPETGAVRQDYDKCIGCRMCMSACPYTGVRSFNWEEPKYSIDHKVGGKGVPEHQKHVVEKCTMCYHLSLIHILLVFLGGGFLFGWWHPGWFVFLTIPLYYWIAHIIENDPNYRANRR